MADDKTRHVVDDFRGGRNGADPSWTLKATECADAVNVELFQTRLGRKRGGMTPLTGGTSFFTTGILSWLYRHVPGTDETAAELWGMDDTATPLFGVLRAGTTFSAITHADAFTNNAWHTTATTINGKLVLSIAIAAGRLQIGGATSALRRAGLIAPAVPTVANGVVGGAYPAVLRYYRIRWTTQAAGITIRRSEPGPSASFTPSGAFTTDVVTRPTLAGESETHWEVEASTDNVSFYRIATVVAATTTYADSALVATYRNNPLSALTGTYTLQKLYKFVAADQNRLLGFGSWITTDKQHRIEYSAVVGSLDVSDEERVDTTVGYYADLDEGDSGVPTGLAGPIYGSFFAFKEQQVWQGTPTGNVDNPYSWKAITKTVGAMAGTAITKGEDALGNPALYWMSRRGPYRWGIFGVEYLGHNVEDYIIGPTAVLNLEATKAKACTVFYPFKRQVWFWWPTGTANDPNNLFIYDIKTSGWSRALSTDLISGVRCATMFATTVGAAMSVDLKPYVGQTGANARLWKADTGTTDNGTLYRGYVVSKDLEPGGPGYMGEVGDAVLLANASGASKTLSVVAAGDFGETTATGTVPLDLAATAHCQLRATGSALGEVAFVNYTIGDLAAIDLGWSLERLIVPVTKRGAVSG